MPHFKVRPSREPIEDECPDRSSRRVLRKKKKSKERKSSAEKLDTPDEVSDDSGRKMNKNGSKKHIPRKCLVIRRTPAENNLEKTELRLVTYGPPREKGEGGSLTNSILIDAAALLAERLKELETSRVINQYEEETKIKKSLAEQAKREEDNSAKKREKAAKNIVLNSALAPLPVGSSADEKSKENLGVHKNNKECKKETKTDVETTTAASVNSETENSALPSRRPLRRFSEESSFMSCNEQCCQKNLFTRAEAEEEMNRMIVLLKRLFDKLRHMHSVRPSDETRVIAEKIRSLAFMIQKKQENGELLAKEVRRNIHKMINESQAYRKKAGIVKTTTVTVTEITDDGAG